MGEKKRWIRQLRLPEMFDMFDGLQSLGESEDTSLPYETS